MSAIFRQKNQSSAIFSTRSDVIIQGASEGAGLRFGIVQSRFNEPVTKRLLDGALEALRAGGARDHDVDVVSVPGAFEIPVVAARMARSGRYDAVICLGAVIRGETPHFEYISAAVSRGIARVASDFGIPVIFGVLTTDTEDQAEARSKAGGEHRGYHAGLAAIEMGNLMKRLDGEFAGKRRRGSVARRARRNRRPPPRNTMR
jgi:6,7-dimethyl-8-ribityllumazine synthase